METVAFESRGNALINLRIFKPVVAELLLATKENLGAKDVVSSSLSPKQNQVRKSSLELFRESEYLSPNNPVLSISVRNILSNLRCVAYEKNAPFICVEGEDVFSPRSYFALGYTSDKQFRLKEVYLRDSSSYSEFEWFITGIPVMWDELDTEQLFRAMLTEAADHSHIYHIPRGKHPEATEESIGQWNKMHALFKENLGTGRDELSDELIRLAKQFKIKRERQYLHNVTGVDPEGNLCQLADKDSLENLGKRLKAEYGAPRAICVDNGGSVETSFYPEGIDKQGWIKCEFGHRFPGTAYIGIALKNGKYKS